MATKPFLTSDDLILAVQRKIGLPLSQQTFTSNDVLKFANEEMMMSQVPSILMYHEEYFVVSEDIPIQADISTYEIPKRAIGLKLRDLYYKDQSGNLIEMTRIAPEDKSFWDQNNATIPSNFQKYYLQGNDIILVPKVGTEATGFLVASYFLRPNQLVTNDETATIQNFHKTIIVDNTTLTAGDTVTIDGETFTAVVGAPSTDEFQIGATSIISASNLSTAINTNGIVEASNGSPATDTVTISYEDVTLEVSSSDSTSLEVLDDIILEFDAIPSSMEERTRIDFLQTEAGHKTYSMDVRIPTGSISGNNIIFPSDLVPSSLKIDDYIALAQECRIPQIPTDLHSSLADRTAIRILESIGDREGVGIMSTRLQEQESRTGTIIDTRVEGSVPKVVNRHSLLRYNKRTRSRRT